MSKHKQILFDWEPPPPAKDAEAAVHKVVAEIGRLSIAGYTPPPPVTLEAQKDMTKSARSRERQREAEHRERIEALEQHEKQLRRQEQRLARLADEKSKEMDQSHR
jgi:hypothetical protein